MGEFRRVSGVHIVDARALNLMRPDAILMHPLPRVGEIPSEVDADPRAAYFRQAAQRKTWAAVRVSSALFTIVSVCGSCSLSL